MEEKKKKCYSKGKKNVIATKKKKCYSEGKKKCYIEGKRKCYIGGKRMCYSGGKKKCCTEGKKREKNLNHSNNTEENGNEVKNSKENRIAPHYWFTQHLDEKDINSPKDLNILNEEDSLAKINPIPKEYTN